MAGTVILRKITITLSVILIGLSLQAQDAGYLGRKYLREANDHYKNGEFGTAAEKYQKSIEADPSSAKSTFNLGNALYRQKMYKEAGEVYEGSIAQIKDPQSRSQAYHNLGNVYMQGNEFQKAVDAYKKALKDNPADEDTRYNLAYAQQKLKQQQQQQKQNQKQNENEDKKEEDKKNEDKKNEDKKNEDKKNEDKKNEDKKNQDQKNQDQKNNDKKGDQKGKPQPNQLSKDQAKKILDALNGNEKKLQDKLNKNKEKAVIGGIEKDW